MLKYILLKIIPVALAMGLSLPFTASAHTVLVSSTPAAGSTVAQLPEQVILIFADPLLNVKGLSINKVQVMDPMNEVITSSDNVVQGNHLSNVLSPSMIMSGPYRVVFRVSAPDGHVLNGSFTFNVGHNSTPGFSIAVPKSGIVNFVAHATGKGVLDGPGSPTESADGSFSINFSTKSFCYQIKSNSRNITAAHVHAASQKNMSIADEIFIPLKLAGINTKAPVCETEPGESLAIIAKYPGRYVFMLHTKNYPDGAVAGFFKKK